MIDLSLFSGKKIAVLGLGKSGSTSAMALQAGGATVLAWDDNAETRGNAQKQNITLVDLNTADFTKIDLLVISPGIPHGFPEPHPVAARAKAAQVPLICDVDLLLQAQKSADVMAITGTNGKSTTTALIGHILENFRPTAVGGNIGLPALTLAPLAKDGTYVLELSSYQLELLPSLAATGVVFLNLSPDHIERHGDMAGYVAAKENIFAAGAGVAVIGVDSDLTYALAEKIKSHGRWSVVRVSTRHHLSSGVCVQDGKLYDNGTLVMDLHQATTLKGVHNHENAACAYAVIKYVYGYEAQEICRHILTFPGLPHRQFQVRQINHVTYINDSKATNADAVARALACYDDIYWIIGGLSKEGGLSGLEIYKDRIRHAFLIGKAADEFALWLKDEGIDFTLCGTLDKAVERSHAMAQSAGQGTVLLSPACASWDQFKSFEQRGDIFTNLVNALSKDTVA